MISISTPQLFLAVLATVTLAVATTGAALRVRYREKGVGRVAPTLTGLFLLFNVLELTWRAAVVADATHVLANRFDVTLLLATLVTAVAFHSQWRSALRGLDTFMLPVAMIVQMFAFLGIRAPTVPDNIGSWFIVHQLSFVVGSALLVCGGVAGGAYLVLIRVLRTKQPSSLLWRLAPLESWERSGRWSLLLGFLCITFGVLTGICEAVQSESTTSHDWLADKFILACMVVWALYALGVAGTWVIPRFRGRWAARLAVVTGLMLVVVFLVVEKMSGVHR